VIAAWALAVLALLGPSARAQFGPTPASPQNNQPAYGQPAPGQPSQGQPGQPFGQPFFGQPGQPQPGQPTQPFVAASTTPAIPLPYLGNPLPLTNGPWVLGEILFFSSGRMVADYAWRDRVRGKRGDLYTKSDIMSDVDNLMGLGKFTSVTPSLYEIPSTPVPPEFATIAVSTSEVRLVFNVVEKVTASTAPVHFVAPPAAVGGIILTPTAYRGAGKFVTPGLGLDFNAMYIIGRLYGKNNYPNEIHHTNYIDRVGVWLLEGDGKMQLQSENELRPAVAVGGQGALLFRDSGQPAIATAQAQSPTVTANASQKSTQLLSDAYFVASKKFGPVRTSVGLLEGSMGNAVAQFSEFLTPDAMTFLDNKPGQTVRSHTVPFFSLFGLPKPSQPLGFEVMKFNGAAQSPWMINFKVGYFLKLNFDVAYLKFQGGYDVLGLIAFRYNQFPRQ